MTIVILFIKFLNFTVFCSFVLPWKESPRILAALNRFGFSYELDNSNCSRLLRGRLYLLPRTGKIRGRSRLVGLDSWIPCVYSDKYGIVGESHPKFADRYILCRMDWYWGCRNSFGRNPIFPRAGNLLAFVLYLYANIINHRT